MPRRRAGDDRGTPAGRGEINMQAASGSRRPPGRLQQPRAFALAGGMGENWRSERAWRGIQVSRQFVFPRQFGAENRPIRYVTARSPTFRGVPEHTASCRDQDQCSAAQVGENRPKHVDDAPIQNARLARKGIDLMLGFRAVRCQWALTGNDGRHCSAGPFPVGGPAVHP
jgi:hypothetical protein